MLYPQEYNNQIKFCVPCITDAFITHEECSL